MVVLPGKIARLELMLKELLAELDEIKDLARSLEIENEKLRSELTEAYKQQNNQSESSNQVAAVNSEPSTLFRLYNEGFHVCNVRFAQSRSEECLFCLSLLRRQDGDGAGEN